MDELWGHRWGYRDTRFQLRPDGCVEVTGARYPISGTAMPDFIPFVAQELGVRLGPPRPQPAPAPVPPPRPHAEFWQAVQRRFPAGRWTQDDRQRLLHSHGQSTAHEVHEVLYGRLARVADGVFLPQSEEDVLAMVELAEAHGVALVPYGGGTSVSCALLLPQGERSLVVVDTRGLRRILWVDESNLRASVEAGITGAELERQLGARGYTCGHEPDSLELSTLGGWIATNASGMKKNRYGNIEDLVESVRLVTPRGVLEQTSLQPRQALGMQPQALIFGSEGNLGLITRAVIRIHPLPERRRYGSLIFPDFARGLACLRDVQRAGLQPASLRLVDNGQFLWSQALRPRAGLAASLRRRLEKLVLHRVLGFAPSELCAATLLLEGSRAEVALQEREIRRLARRHGGFWGGETNGRRGYLLTFAIAYIRDFLAELEVMGETFETTVAWSDVERVIAAVQGRAREEHSRHGLPGRPYLSVRVTQTYHTGVCLYFTHGYSVRGISPAGPLAAAIERALREAIVGAGGSVSHHHGVGKLRAGFLDGCLTPAAREAVRAFKTANDPADTFGIGNGVFAP